MRVQNSALSLTSSHRLEERYSRTEVLEVRVNPPAPQARSDDLTISQEAKCLSGTGKAGSTTSDKEDIAELEPRLFVIKKLVEALTGKKIRLIKASDLIPSEEPEIPPPDSSGQGPAELGRVGWGVRYEFHESNEEKETTSFQATGVVRTGDGKEIRFALNLTMSREFVQRTDISLRAGDAALTDPLVINFNGTAAQLTGQRFAFDLDMDGREESIPLLSGGSGFLVFDRNMDGVVNNGGELFGPSTGNGFTELSRFDENLDGWIDENEAVYKNLFVWTRDPEGNDQLRQLKDSGVGSISTASVDTSFELKDSSNQLMGQTVRTGVYLTEAGEARTIQQLLVKA